MSLSVPVLVCCKYGLREESEGARGRGMEGMGSRMRERRGDRVSVPVLLSLTLSSLYLGISIPLDHAHLFPHSCYESPYPGIYRQPEKGKERGRSDTTKTRGCEL